MEKSSSQVKISPVDRNKSSQSHPTDQIESNFGRTLHQHSGSVCKRCCLSLHEKTTGGASGTDTPHLPLRRACPPHPGSWEADSKAPSCFPSPDLIFCHRQCPARVGSLIGQSEGLATPGLLAKSDSGSSKSTPTRPWWRHGSYMVPSPSLPTSQNEEGTNDRAPRGICNLPILPQMGSTKQTQPQDSSTPIERSPSDGDLTSALSHHQSSSKLHSQNSPRECDQPEPSCFLSFNSRLRKRGTPQLGYKPECLGEDKPRLVTPCRA